MPDSTGSPLPGEPGYVALNQSGGLVPAQPTSNQQTVVPTPAAATASTATANPFTVAPNQTVASNIESIIAKDSPLLQQANTRAMDRVNARGLLDSSIGISAGQSALYDAALPIAQQDAQTYNQAATNTTTAQNQAGLLNAQLGTGVSQSNAAAVNTQNLQTQQIGAQEALQTQQIGAQNQLQQRQLESQAALQAAQNSTTMSVAEIQAAQSRYNADLAASNANHMQEVQNAFAAATQATDIAGRTVLQNLQSQTQRDIANIQLTGNTVMQTSASATSMFQTGMGMIRDVIADSTIPPETKTALVNGYLQWMRQGINVIGNVNHVDVAPLLDFSNMTVGP